MKTPFLVSVLVACLLPTLLFAAGSTYKFQNNLALGSSGEDVVQLQNFLESQNLLIIPPGISKGYFGQRTRAALANYQLKFHISPMVGFFGPITRRHIQDQLNNNLSDGERENANLLLIGSEGGLCPSGQICSARVVVKRNGDILAGSELDKSASNTEKLDIAEVDHLQDLIESTDFTMIRRVPFTDTCPTAYDGSKTVYTFETSHGEEIIDSCVTKIDYTLPLFIAIQKLFQKSKI